MCRWLAYTGSPLQMESVLFKAKHSLIDQSLHARMSVTTTNGDGFGLGWYSPPRGGRHPNGQAPNGAPQASPPQEPPFRYRSVHPAWNDRNLREAARAIHAPLFVAHIRAATDTPAQETNCHPFRHGNWLFVHNGVIRDYPLLRRDLMLMIAPSYFGSLEGSTDSEVMFLLALTFGLEEDALPALARMVGAVEETGRRHGVAQPINMTVCALDGERLIAVRYSSERESRTLFHNTCVQHLRQLYPDDPQIASLDDNAFLLLSEPLTEMPGAWEEVPEATAIIAAHGRVEHYPFVPVAPGA
ncbi:Gamma-glutamyl-hercynylcysteine sulfoxide hydrolase [Achromobacter deleyi]|uniref:Gamma-glutamyl-hercynylcysteine sulfoxide hydrolase n=1 Tax=Achromobacter deleyi TaxID=1353891 RepID=A0A6S7A321_9BURK|nr:MULTISPECIES: class II glutamine amidotransferase [Achromobacter]CAB3710257.1 Gamma-glutamyl-hercynylcysteine sulfoxide hydrolase [Achromobacter deleyi]CAB3872743.1 Gamma-glutamyl-hercynylcysteine sulfoxide hydrolase [Achromobacter deleyi]CAB3896340.1 Gamma-glutamyl-hercynylcysteine sulfoxide hydrolase [Achromobacter deleyi]